MHEAFNQAKRESNWKAQVQSFEWNELQYINEISRQIKEKTYEPQDTNDFDLNERGKLRHIKANTIKDRVVNTVIENYVLLPLTEPKLIYDNGASRKGKGTDFTRQRLEKHLHDAMINYGPQATIAVFDFHNFFGSILIDKLMDRYKEIIDDEDVLELLEKLLRKHNDGDVGVGIGSIISQNAGIYYPNLLDNYIKIVLGYKYYGRYMDDFYIICKSRAEAKDLYPKIRDYVSKNLYLELNDKKIQIKKLTDGFSFMKFYYRVTETGKVIKRQNGDTFIRERRKLKRYKAKGFPVEDIQDWYNSWRGNVVKYYANYPRVLRTDALFKQLFPQGVIKETKYDLRYKRQYSKRPS